MGRGLPKLGPQNWPRRANAGCTSRKRNRNLFPTMQAGLLHLHNASLARRPIQPFKHVGLHYTSLVWGIYNHPISPLAVMGLASLSIGKFVDLGSEFIDLSNGEVKHGRRNPDLRDILPYWVKLFLKYFLDNGLKFRLHLPNG